MPFSFVDEEECNNEDISSTSDFDQEIDEVASEKSKKILAELFEMSEEDFKWYIRNATAWKYSDGKLFQRPI